MSIYTISTVHIITLVILIAFSVYIYLRANKDQMLYNFLAVQGAFGIWIVAKILKTVSPVFGMRWFFVVMQYFGICMLQVVFLNFAFNYSKGKNLPKWFLRIFIPLSCIQFLFIASNEYHHLFYSVFTFTGDKFGKLFYVHVGIMYSSIVAGIILISRRFKKDFYNSAEYIEISLAIIIPLFANIFYLSGYYHELMRKMNLRPFDITPLAFSLSLGVFAYAIYNRDFLDLMPVFEDEIIKHTKTGIGVLDTCDFLVDVNQSGKGYIETIALPNNYWKGSEEIDRQIKTADGKIIHVQKKILIDKGSKHIGYILMFNDITSYMSLSSEIKEQVEELKAMNYELKEKIQLNDVLSKISVRNYVAREVHDILGHSMTLAIKLMEIGKMDYQQEHKKELLEQRLNEAYEICQKGYTDLRRSLRETQEITYDFISLKTEINKIGKVVEVAGVEFELVIPKIYGLLREDEYQVIKRFVQESITNSVKHGKATKIIVFVEMSKKQNRIRIEDNGMGCLNLVKGNGLKGMEFRAKSINGSVDFSNVESGGFAVELEY